MKTRLVVTVTGLLAIGLAIPTAAQRPTTCDGPQDACQQIIRSFEQFVTAFNNKDVAGAIMGFTDDAVLVGEGRCFPAKRRCGKTTVTALRLVLLTTLAPSIRYMSLVTWHGPWGHIVSPGPVRTMPFKNTTAIRERFM